MSFKHKVRIREVVKGRFMIKDDRAKTYIDKKTGIYWWVLLKYRTKIPEPNSDCVDITNKGQKIAEYFKTSDGQFIPARCCFDYKSFQEGDEEKGVNAFRPYNANQRSMLVQEHRASEDYKKKKISDMIMQLAPLILAVMIVVSFMLFFGEVVAPTKDFADNLVVASEKLSVTVNKMEDIILERERLKNEVIIRSDDEPITPPN